jgi:hypothetical protein
MGPIVKNYVKHPMDSTGRSWPVRKLLRLSLSHLLCDSVACIQKALTEKKVVFNLHSLDSSPLRRARSRAVVRLLHAIHKSTALESTLQIHCGCNEFLRNVSP